MQDADLVAAASVGSFLLGGAVAGVDAVGGVQVFRANAPPQQQVRTQTSCFHA